MGKYEPLAHYLSARADNSWNATFAQIEEKLGFPLPRSAYEHRAWWSNQKAGHSQTAGWQDAGWETRDVDLAHGVVRFERSQGGKSAKALDPGDPSSALWEKASKLSGIPDRNELIAAALDALIQREVAKGLIALGGSDPDAKAPPRRRFW